MNLPKRKKRLSERSIYRFVNRCRLEARKCEDVRAYVAAIILLGAAMEYLLSAWIRAYPSAIHCQGKKLSNHWDLKQLTDAAYQAGFLDHGAFRAAERIRRFRNLVHPNWYAGRKPIRFTRHLLDARIQDFDIFIESMQKNL